MFDFSGYTHNIIMFRLTHFLVVIIICGLGLQQSIAQTSPSLNFQTMSTEINRAPWPNYQTLLAYQQANQNLPRTRLLWLLLLKAQAENLLYFYDKFEQTVIRTKGLVTPDTPVKITSLLHFYTGLIEQRTGSYAKAIQSFNLAIQQAKQNGLNQTYFLAKQELAYTQSLSDSFQASLTEIQDAYSQAITLGDVFLLATINETYGAIYGYMGKYELSIKYYQQALKGYQNLGYPPYEAEAIYGIASTYRYWKKYDLSIANFELYIERINYTPNKEISFYGNYGLAMTLAERGSCPQALKAISKTLKLNGQADYNAELFKRKAICFIQLKQYQNAKLALEQANKIFEQMPELIGTRWQLETLKIAGDLAFALEDYIQAYQLITKYYQKQNKRLTDSSTERLTNLRATYEIERRDSEIKLLQQQANLQLLKTEQHQQSASYQRYLLLLSILLAFIILTAFVLQRRYTNKVLAVSIRDSLSGLFNRRYIFELFEKQVQSLAGKKGNLSVVILDIDDFKNINDQYGHPFGDQVIRIISEICQAKLRTEDAIGRIGGEEFLCLLPRISSETCLSIARRMSENIEQYAFTNDCGETFFVTVSIGISTASSSETKSTTELFLQADKALYHSKEHGKNKITFFDDINKFIVNENLG